MNYSYDAPSPPESIKSENDDTESRLVLALAPDSNFYQELSPQPTSPEDFDHDRSSISKSPTPDELKKPAKKRKSWGQQLPTPTTNLPPRKRAKTDAEKEQRRVERVLRNRLAAQTSRERKRKEMEALEEKKKLVEKENEDLHKEVLQLRKENESLNTRMLMMEGTIETLKRVMEEEKSMVGTGPLFAAHSHTSCEHGHIVGDCLRHSYPTTCVNETPQTLDPNNTQYDDEYNDGLDNHHAGLTGAEEELPNLSSTQHPAAVLCSFEDLQCLTRAGTTPSQTGLELICWILGNFFLICFSAETTQSSELSTLLKAWMSLLETWFSQAPSLEQLIPSSLPLAHLIMVATGYVSRNQICEKVSDLGKSVSKEFPNALKADVFLGHSPTISPTVLSVDLCSF